MGQAHNLPTARTRSNGAIAAATYDVTGNLLTVKDPRNQVTTIAYNSFGQPTSVQGPILTEPPDHVCV